MNVIIVLPTVTFINSFLITFLIKEFISTSFIFFMMGVSIEVVIAILLFKYVMDMKIDEMEGFGYNETAFRVIYLCYAFLLMVGFLKYFFFSKNVLLSTTASDLVLS